MAGDFCPRCGTARVGDFRYCRGCQFDFATLGPAVNESPSEPPTQRDAATTPTPPGMSFSEHYAGTRYSASYVEPPPIEEHEDERPSARPAWLPRVVAFVWVVMGLLWVIAGVGFLGVSGGLLPRSNGVGMVVLVQGLLSLVLAYRVISRPTRAAFDASAAWGVLGVAGALLTGGGSTGVYLAVGVMALVTVLSLAGRRQAFTSPPDTTAGTGIEWAQQSDPRPGSGRKAQVAIAVLGVLALVAVVSVMPGGAPRAVADPPQGTILFGDSWDRTTGLLRGQRTTATVGEDTAYVVHPTRTVTEQVIRLSITVNGQALPSSTIDVSDPPWDVFGGTLPGVILYEAGQVVVRISDVGNTTLAQTTLTVTP